MKLFEKIDGQNRKQKILITGTVIVIVSVVFFLNKISAEFYEEMKNQKKAELERLVEIGYKSIVPYIDQAKTGELDKDEALDHIRNIIRRLSYSDDFGTNYIFMSSYDGTMLVQPFEPEKEGTNQWNLKDVNGDYILRRLVLAAVKHPQGAFVTYSYCPPGSDKPEEKLSYVKSLPFLDAYIGTGMYMESGYVALNKLLRWQKYVLVACGGVLVLVMLIYINELIHEIKYRQIAENSLRQEKELLSVTLQSIGDGVIAADKNSHVTLINKVAEVLTGWKENEAIGQPLEKVFYIINEETRKICENPVERVLSTGNVIGLANHTALISKEGQERAIADSAAPIKDNNGKILGVVLVFRDVTEDKKQEREILQLSYHDSLTGLYNRRFFEEAFSRMLGKEYLPVTVVLGDVNGLKMTNDIFGHEEGDNLLKKIAQILTESCGENDIIARWGGDEFIILMPNTSESEAEEVCEKIKMKCDAYQEGALQASISLGYATKQFEDESIWEKQKEAEEWMYRNKLLKSKSFRNRVIASLRATLFEKSMETEEHAERLKCMSIQMGKALGLTSLHLNELELLAMLHDIGKIGIRESILAKTSELTKSEWDEMRKHSEIGYRIAQATPELSKIAEYILCHHEWWNGRGYPQGLKGEHIPVLSRILSVADAYDAMTSDRSYHAAISKEEAISEIQKCAGIQFDPELVKIFTSLFYNKAF